MKSYCTAILLLLATIQLQGPTVASAQDRVERPLNARVTFGQGIYAPFVGEIVTVTIIYDRTLQTSGTASGIANTFRSWDPPANVGKTIGVRISVGGPGGIENTTEGVADDHEIDLLDTEFLDQWSIDSVDIDAPHQASVTLRGGPDFLLSGTGGLTEDVDVFPPDLCSPGATLTIGNFGTGGGPGESGSMIYQFGPDAGCGTATTTTTTTSTTTTTMPTGADVCGDPVALVVGSSTTPGLISASDALFTLSAAVGISSCALCVCDVDDSGAVVATDALSVLNAAVALPITLVCPPCGGCGDGVVDDPVEECDDGNAVNDDDCTNFCTIPFCGDGIVQPQAGETCDDGNSEEGDGCPADCGLN